jgi:hypothetical protein
MLMTRRHSFGFFVLASAALLLRSTAAVAQGPVAGDDLLRLVPKQTAFCLVVNDLRGYADKIAQAPWYKALSGLPWSTALAVAPELAAVGKFEDHLQKHLGTDWRQLRDDILGDRVVFAFLHGPPNKMREERGLFLLRARNARALADVIDRLNQSQKKKGELTELEILVHNDAKFVRRVERGGSHYYYLKDRLLAVSEKEDLIRGVIDREAEGSPDNKPTIARQLQRAGADRALAALWVNPRAFDAEILGKAKVAKGPEAKGLEALLAFWKATDAIIVSFTLEKNLELALTVQARPDDLPPAAQRLFTRPAKPSELWSRFPPNALFTIAGQLDAADLSESINQLTLPDQRKAGTEFLQGLVGAILGVDVERELLPNLGPDWGVCMAPPAEKTDIPQVLVALAVRPGNGESPVDQALARALQTLASLGVLGYNRDHPEDPIRVQKLKQGNVEVKYFATEKLFPPGFRPALALKEGYLVVASSPDAIEQFRTRKDGLPGGEAPILRLSLTELAKYLKQRRELAVTFVSEQSRAPEATAQQWVDATLSGLELFDSLTLTHRTEPGQLTWALRLSAAPKTH